MDEIKEKKISDVAKGKKEQYRLFKF